MDSKHILVIDDEKAIRTTIQISLEILRGWKVTLAESGEKGLQKLEAERPDAILLDLEMGGMNGIFFVRKLRERPMLCNIPIVLITTQAHFMEPIKYRHMGINGFISKPFEALKLADQVADILRWE